MLTFISSLPLRVSSYHYESLLEGQIIHNTIRTKSLLKPNWEILFHAGTTKPSIAYKAMISLSVATTRARHRVYLSRRITDFPTYFLTVILSGVNLEITQTS